MKDLKRLTLEEKLGQLFFLGFHGSAPDLEAQALIDRIRPSGFVFFQRNIENFDQFSALTARFSEQHGLPLLLAIDHEGGRVDRLKQVFGPMPSMAELASSGTAHLRAGAKIIASELEAVGLNLDLAPVLDLSSAGSLMAARGLSANPIEITRLASAFIEELAKKNLLTCAKHFPGLGAATSDPHFVLPRVTKTKKLLLQEDVIPFLNLIDEVPMMMVSHAHYPGLGDEKALPASLSARIVSGLLRKKIGYAGVIATDDLTMGAITSVGLTPDVFLHAFEAGNDLLMFTQCTPLVEKGFNTVLRAVRASAILQTRLDESVSRILSLKARIQYTPIRYRTQVKTRIARQIDKLRDAVEESTFRV